MVDLTSAHYCFRRALAEGDLWDALGLARGASKLDVDVAGARLAERAPAMAQEISKVVNVLTHDKRRAAYEAVRKLCDKVIAAFEKRHGPEFAKSFSDYRQDLWQRCCWLFHFDPGIQNQVLGSRGMESLARQGRDWIIHDFLAAHITEAPFADHELTSGSPAPRRLLDRFFELQGEGKDVSLSDVQLETPPQTINPSDLAQFLSSVKSPKPDSQTAPPAVGKFLAGLALLVVFLLLATATNRNSQNRQPSTPQWTPPTFDASPWKPSATSPQWTPSHTDFPALPISSFQHEDNPVSNWLRNGGSTEDIPPNIVKQEFERQEREEHQCAAHPCPAYQSIQQVLDAMEKGERVRGYIDNGKLQVDLLGPATFPIKIGSPLHKWLQEGNDQRSPTPEILRAELMAQKQGHHCNGAPCLGMRRIQM